MMVILGPTSQKEAQCNISTLQPIKKGKNHKKVSLDINKARGEYEKKEHEHTKK